MSRACTERCHKMEQPRFGRMIPAMVTPMKENLELDLDRAQELADRLVKGGADSLIINGTTGACPADSRAPCQNS